ncbi:alpha/beta hydrolase [Streptomyces sp. NPDC097619]|uniref:alpha/beta hydrolase n=1 Tax=Streptomyces sp. NPDC097619 TaxID=3157228 RepID=UPI00332FB52C
MRFLSEQLLDDGVRERRFTLDGVPGILWTPASAPDPAAPSSSPSLSASAAPSSGASAAAPLVLLGHPPLGLDAMYPRLVARARQAAADGFASATLELPGSGERPRLPGVDRARAELRRRLRDGEPVGDRLVDELVLPLVERAVPEWRTALDSLVLLPGLGGPVGYSGGLISVGTRLAAVEPRVSAAVLFAGSFVPRVSFEEARRVTVPVHVLLQWDDEGNDRQAALDLFDAFGSADKTLHANTGGHTGVPAHAGDAAQRFFVRHLA